MEQRTSTVAADDLVLGPYEALEQRWRITTPDADLAGLLEQLYAAMQDDHGVGGEPHGDGGPDGDGKPDPDGAPDDGPVIYRITPPTDDQPGMVTRDGARIGGSRAHAAVLGKLVWAINQQVIKGASGDRLLLHAAAADLDGDGVLVPARMESGKTTLVTGLLDRGFGYLSDEAAAVLGDLHLGASGPLYLEGYAKPLSIDPGSWEVLAHHRPQVEEAVAPYFATQWQVPAQRLGPVVRRTRLSMIVLRRYDGGGPLHVRRLAAPDALELAVHATFAIEGRPHLTAVQVRALVSVLERTPTYEVVGGELNGACDAVMEALAEVRSDGDADSWRPS